MSDIRPPNQEQLDQLDALYPRAFPEEDLLPLITALKSEDDVHHRVALHKDKVIGHVALCDCAILDEQSTAALLGPLAVDPDHQRRGIGAALVAETKRMSRDLGADRLVVLGSPDYYGKQGFAREDEVQTPYQIPAEWGPAWQSVVLNRGAFCTGVLDVPAPWRDPALWA